jgi:branched-subunit amino acid aminotransferase/4-amino-4-deoxychorismate lyase
MYRGDQVTEGTKSNVFWIKDNVMYTPPLTANILPGITRKHVLEIAACLGIPYETPDKAYFQALKSADAAFITNTSCNIRALSHLDDQPFPASTDHPIIEHLHHHFYAHSHDTKD